MKQLIPKQSAAVTAGLSFLAALILAAFFGSTGLTAQAAGETTLTFTDNALTAAGTASGYEIDGTDLTITAAGTYRLTGSCSEGSVTVKKGTTGVTLILDDLTLTSSDSAAISCNKETDVTLQLEGSSVLTDGEDIANEAEDTFDGAAVKVKSGASLNITGTGTLTVQGDCKNGIKGGALATITQDSGTLIIDAENNGLACDNALVIRGGTLTVTAGNDGVKAEPDEDDTESAGTITISGGSITVNAAGDGIQSVGTLTVSGGTFQITAGDDGVKSASDLALIGGIFDISAADDGISADYVLSLGTKDAASGPDITIRKCEEGLEGATVNLYSGKAVITANDDGINAANKDLSDYTYAINIAGGSWYINANGDALDSNRDITVTGGTTEVYGAPNGGNSGLDFDGTCSIQDGTLFVVDCTGMNQVPSNGTYVLFGQSGMMGGGMQPMSQGGELPQEGQMPDMSQMPQMRDGAQGPQRSDGMTPPDFSGSWEEGRMPGGAGGFPGSQTLDTSAINIQSGSKIEVRDSSGAVLYSGTGTKVANSVMLASSDLKAGETYTLFVDGVETATAQAQEGTGQTGMGFAPGGQQGQMPAQPGGQSGNQPSQPAQSSTGYSDVADNAWYRDAVQYVTENRMMNGTGQSSFSPDTNTTRAMVVTILYRLEGAPSVTGGSYSDVSSGAWYADAVAWAQTNGIVNGTGDGRFSPDEAITRQQLAAILYRYAQYKDYNLGQTASLTGFSDGDQVQSYARNAMEWACGTKLIQGTDENRLSPNGGATRAQVATILQRLCETFTK